MTNMKTLLGATGLAALLAVPAFAQEQGIFGEQDNVNDAITDIEDTVVEDFEQVEEARTFGVGQQRLGWSGTISATGNMTSGNSDTSNVGIGARFGYADGVNAHEFSLSYGRSEENGNKTSDRLLAGYDYNRYFNDNFYYFAKARTSRDEFSSFDSDSFVAAGIGYRIINTETTSWAIQAGPGYRVAKYTDGTEIDEVAGALTSKFYYGLSSGMSITNDTDVLFSETDTSVINDLGLNVSLNGPLALRTSLLTEYHSDPQPGLESTDHTTGISLVYSFD